MKVVTWPEPIAILCGSTEMRMSMMLAQQDVLHPAGSLAYDDKAAASACKIDISRL